MYLISLYFDEETNERMYEYIKNVSVKSGNTFMTDNQVPPHVTISAFGCSENSLVKICDAMDKKIDNEGEVYFATLGQFMPHVIYTAAVVNEYLHELSQDIYNILCDAGEDVKVSRYYRPFQWVPHVTIAKTLTKEQMMLAFTELLNTWGAHKGRVIKIGLAKTNPYENIKLWMLK